MEEPESTADKPAEAPSSEEKRSSGPAPKAPSVPPPKAPSVPPPAEVPEVVAAPAPPAAPKVDEKPAARLPSDRPEAVEKHVEAAFESARSSLSDSSKELADDASTEPARVPPPPASSGRGLEPPVVAKAQDPPDGGPAAAARRSSSGAFPGKTPPKGGPLAAYEAVARSARLGDLVAIANAVITDAARARHADWSFVAKVAELAEEAKLPRAEADTPFGNGLKVLGSGPEDEAERALACALWAHAVAESPRKRSEDEERLAGDVLWLATHTAFDATPLLDRALGEDAADLWTAIAARVRRIEAAQGGARGRGEAIVGCAALAASGSPKARALAAELEADIRSTVLLRVLAAGERSSPEEVRVEGELVASPRGAIVTALLALTGLLFVIHAVRIVARLALAYRRPAEVSLSDSGVRVKSRTEMLGRTLREREHVILRAGLVRVVREVRYPRAAFYAGLFALAIGSYLGVRAFVDGVRAASPSLLVVGLVLVAVGIGLDFVLGSLVPGARGRCRVSFVPRKGKTLTVANVDADRADDAIKRALRA